MKAIALTGSLGSGKSAVLKFVRSSGIPTIDCDAIVSALYRKSNVRKKLSALFGTANRKKIAEIVFDSPKKRKRLERLLHPLVWKAVKARLSSFTKQGKQLAIVDVPLLFEARWERRFDSVIFVRAPKKKCVLRLVAGGMKRRDALRRWKSQLSQGKKIKKAGHVIDNSGSLAETRKQVRQLLSKLLVK